jgi:dynein heavy chain
VRNCLAFGPGLLADVACGVPVPFLIQALDTMNDYRTTGGDRFAVRVVSADGKVEGEARITDLNDGKYEVHYSVPLPGHYLVHVSHADLGGTDQIPVRGSPFKVAAVDQWTKHRLLGTIPAVSKVRVATCRGSLQSSQMLSGSQNISLLFPVSRRVPPCHWRAAPWCCWEATRQA